MTHHHFDRLNIYGSWEGLDYAWNTVQVVSFLWQTLCCVIAKFGSLAETWE